MWRHVTVGAEDSAAAAELADRLRLELPPGSSVVPRPLSNFRRWLLRETLLGNYA